jgi:hypothetical protein
MRIIFCIIGILLINPNLYSQITVTENNVLSINDQINLCVDENNLVNAGSSGVNINWDFSTLNVMNSMTWQCLSPNNTPFASSYPGANICIEDFGDYLYFNKSNNKVELLGQNDSTLQTPVVILPLPLTYGLSYTDGPITALDSVIYGPAVNFLLASQGLSASILSGFAAHSADTLSIQATITTDFNVDAHGEITIPMGTYDCLRLKMERTTNTTIEIYCTDTITGAGSGWYPVPFSDIQEEVSYQWWSNDPITKFALVEMIVDSVGNSDGPIQFLHNATNNIQEAPSFDAKIYPVPSKNELNIQIEGFKETTLMIFDIQGKLIDEMIFWNEKRLDLNTFDKGVYIFSFYNGVNTIEKKIIVE